MAPGLNAPFRCRAALCVAGMLAAVAVLAAAPLAADTLTKTDGTVYRGRILRETPATVEMEVEKYGAKFTMKVPRLQIRSIVRGEDKPAALDPVDRKPAATRDDDTGAAVAYYPLPVMGRLGEETQAELFATALDDALANKPDVIVLYVNSTGGSVAEADRITKLLARARAKAKGVRFAAYVRHAQAAAAAVALWCPDICMDPKGRLLAAETPTDDPDVQLDDAVSINAGIAQAAKAGGHAELLIRGLTDPDLALAVTTDENGKPLVKEGLAGRPLTDKGKPLILTGQKAVEAGLAKGLADTVHGMKRPLGIPRWKKINGKGWAILARHAVKYRAEAEKAKLEKRRAEAKLKREELMARIAPELERLESQITAVKQKGRQAEAQLNKAARAYDSAVNKAKRDCDSRIRQLRRSDAHKDRRYASWVRKARQDRDKAIASAQKRHGPAAQKARAEVAKCLAELRKLENDKKKLLRGAAK